MGAHGAGWGQGCTRAWMPGTELGLLRGARPQALDEGSSGTSSTYAKAQPVSSQSWPLLLISCAVCRSAGLQELGRHVGGSPLVLNLLPVVAAGVQQGGAGGGDL